MKIRNSLTQFYYFYLDKKNFQNTQELNTFRNSWNNVYSH